MHHENLAREGETDAVAALLGGEEGDEYLPCYVQGDDVAVVGVEEPPAWGFGTQARGLWRDGAEADSFRLGFDGVLGEVDEDLSQQVLVGLQDEVGGNVYLPLQIRIERGDASCEGGHVYVGDVGLLQLCQLAVAFDEGHQSGAGIVDGLYAFLVVSVFDVGIAEVCLADALYGCGGVHNLVRQHARQPLPRLHLAVRHLLFYLLSHVVERLLQGLLSEQEAPRRQPEREVPMPDGIAHDLRPLAQQTLMPVPAEHSQRCPDKNHGEYVT